MIVLGDLHLGIKNFDRQIYLSMIDYLKGVIDYSAEKDDKVIFQLGDMFNNRTTTNILFLEEVKELFNYLKEKEVVLHSLLGNHDIYYRERKDISLVKHFNNLYPENFKIYEDKEDFIYHNKVIYVVPWLVKEEGLSKTELKGKDIVFGHLEIAGFEVTKGHYDEKSQLSKSFFEKLKLPVLSGHYHIRNTEGIVKYLGTPYQLNWSDFNEIKGFYILDPDLNLSFIKNTLSPIHIKLIYNEDYSSPLEIKGTDKEIRISLDQLENYIDLLKNSYIKFIINKSSNSKHEEFIFELQKHDISFAILNNQELNNSIEYNPNVTIKPSKEVILDYIKEHRPELVKLAIDLFSEVDTQKNIKD